MPKELLLSVETPTGTARATGTLEQGMSALERLLTGEATLFPDELDGLDGADDDE